jgi:sugar lactone lactonase YvrE
MKISRKGIYLLSSLLIMATILFAYAFETNIFNDPPRIPIERVAYFPNDIQVENGCLLKNVGPICTDARTYIYVADWNYCTIHKFDMNGKLLSSFGNKGQGPGEFQSINSMAAFKQGLALVDAGNMRIVIVDSNDKQLKAFKIFKAYTGIATSEDGTSVYVTPRSTQSKLIEILDQSGKLLGSFGERISFNNKNSALNTTFLQRNSLGELWVAWKYFPIVRRYNRNGELLNEFTLRDKSLSEYVQKNHAVADSAQIGSSITLFGIISGFYVTDGRCYVLLYGKDEKPRIAEYNYQGNLKAAYEIADPVDKVIFINIIIDEQNRDKAFYILQGFPEARIDMFKIAIKDFN